MWSGLVAHQHVLPVLGVRFVCRERRVSVKCLGVFIPVPLFRNQASSVNRIFSKLLFCIDRHV